ncbi:anthranilate phosphoribosyltransferase [Petrocella sp. FN5]|uniref:anthranilate phosphoribosyltransferase n=1 Tax=Petrocella sp. FN5 TaxID=3032002 RepID=UPI0023D9C398|nr:anthranilate phosphoribosyltransferase [Petrocella sp. FN5]MDF1617579.1 anthranilate phosphoribosyltransferase [Petrocella sp. FN5]
MAHELLDQLIIGQDLTEEQMMIYMNEIMSGEKCDAEIASFLTALKIKGESIHEIVAGAKVLREKALPIDLQDIETLDTCGTGGDSSGTYNISTAVAVVAAAAGVSVVKHGNRSVSSKCGCADVLEACGVKIDLNPEQVKACIDELQIGFLFAPTFHSAMRHVGPTRKALGFRTIFNILGPLANPANAKSQVLGVFDKALVDIFARVLQALGVQRAMVVHGKDGLDEITVTDETYVSELRDGNIVSYIIKPEDCGIDRATIEDLQGGDVIENAQILRQVLSGEIIGPKRDILVLNAGAALFIADKVKDIHEGIELAKHIIDTGLAISKLEAFATKTQEFAKG